MNRKTKLILVMTSFSTAVFITLYLTFGLPNKNVVDTDPFLQGIDTTQITKELPSIQMYYFIKKYSQAYDIPESYAFSVAYVETRYKGPLDSTYNHAKRSYAGALGPMQIMPSTAKLVEGKTVPKFKLNTDIELNVRISMQLLRILHDKYKDWPKVFGAYNTGRPCVNRYAHMVLNHKHDWQK